MRYWDVFVDQFFRPSFIDLFLSVIAFSIGMAFLPGPIHVVGPLDLVFIYLVIAFLRTGRELRRANRFRQQIIDAANNDPNQFLVLKEKIEKTKDKLAKKIWQSAMAEVGEALSLELIQASSEANESEAA